MEEDNYVSKIRMIGPPEEENGVYVFPRHVALLGKECGWQCPKCKSFMVITPYTPGMQIFKCDNCKVTKFKVFVDENAITVSGYAPKKKDGVGTHEPVRIPPVESQNEIKPAVGMLLTPPPDDPSDDNPVPPFINRDPVPPQPTPIPPPKPTPIPTPPPTPVPPPNPPYSDDSETIIGGKSSMLEPKGVLTWGGWLNKKHYNLHKGENTIGREDSKTPSDLQFTDKEMSRRSVCIDAEPDGKGGHYYTLSVMKALNPVLVNRKNVEVGHSVRLNNGDTITMGATTLTFKSK